MVKNPLYNSEDIGLIPGQGPKIPRALGQLSLYATTRDLQRKILQDRQKPWHAAPEA